MAEIKNKKSAQAEYKVRRTRDRCRFYEVFMSTLRETQAKTHDGNTL